VSLWPFSLVADVVPWAFRGLSLTAHLDIAPSLPCGDQRGGLAPVEPRSPLLLRPGEPLHRGAPLPSCGEPTPWHVDGALRLSSASVRSKVFPTRSARLEAAPHALARPSAIIRCAAARLCGSGRQFFCRSLFAQRDRRFRFWAPHWLAGL